MDKIGRISQGNYNTPPVKPSPDKNAEDKEILDLISLGGNNTKDPSISDFKRPFIQNTSTNKTAESQNVSKPSTDSEQIKDSALKTAVTVSGVGVGGALGVAIATQGLNVILIRHGETPYNKEGRLQGQVDIPLSEKGHEQAEDASKRLMDFIKDTDISAIYCSDLTRTRQTAAPFIDALKASGKDVPVHYTEELREMKFGVWEGKTPAQIKEEAGGVTPSPFERWQKDPRSITPEGAENVDDFYNRIVSTVRGISSGESGEMIFAPGTNPEQSKKNDKTIVIFTHGGAIAMLLNNIQGRDPGNLIQFKLPNAGGPVLDYNEGKFKENGMI